MLSFPHALLTPPQTKPHLEVDLEQLLPLVRARQRDVYALLQPPPQRLVDVPREVGGRQHDDVLALLALLAVAAVYLALGRFRRSCLCVCFGSRPHDADV